MSLYDKLLHVLLHHTLDELGILPCAPDQDTLPHDTQCYHPLVVLDGKLGIGFDDLATLLQETQERFVRFQQQRLDESDPSFEQLTRIMILFKPEHYTAMNARKRLVLAGGVSIQQELQVLELIFTVPRNTKCSIAWHHRQWLFSQNMNLMQLDVELALCRRSITLYPRNYYAWNHKHWLLDWMDKERMEQEYQETCQWIEKNVSDHSGIRYLEHIVKRAKTDSLDTHGAWLDALIMRYPGHESLWCHRRYCATLAHRPDADHAFVRHILENQPQSDTLLAAKFGLWICHFEAKQGSRVNSSLVDIYLDQVRKMDSTPIYLHHWKKHLGLED